MHKIKQPMSRKRCLDFWLFQWSNPPTITQFKKLVRAKCVPCPWALQRNVGSTILGIIFSSSFQTQVRGPLLAPVQFLIKIKLLWSAFIQTLYVDSAVFKIISSSGAIYNYIKDHNLIVNFANYLLCRSCIVRLYLGQ